MCRSTPVFFSPVLPVFRGGGHIFRHPSGGLGVLLPGGIGPGPGVLQLLLPGLFVPLCLAGYTPYEGFPIRGGIRQVWLRGRLAVEDGFVLAGPDGKYISRGKCSL